MERSVNGKGQSSLLPANLIEGAADSARPPGSASVSVASEDQDHANTTGLMNGLDDDDDDDFELTFSLDQPRGSESPAQTRQLFRSEEYRQLFRLPPEEVLIRDFNCALQKKILLQGHMYLFEHYVCFYSNIFGYEKKKVIVLKDVTSIRKARTAGLFPNAIEIVAWGKRNFFASFLFRDEAYRLIVEGWSRHSRYARAGSDPQVALLPGLPKSDLGQAAQDQQDACFSESSFESRDILEVAVEQNCEAEQVQENGSKVGVVEVPDNSQQKDEASVVEVPDNSQQKDGSNGLESTDARTAETSALSSSTLWEVEDVDAPKVPGHYKTVLECELPVGLEEFFHLFLSDESAKFFETFHRKCGDEDFHCTDWSKHRHFGHVRDVSFQHPVKALFGPKATYCQEVQRYRVYQDRHLIMETSQQMNDIPYGDYFRVEGWWDVIASPNVDGVVSVRISVDVAFSKKTVWKGKIEQGTYDECKEVFATWLTEILSTLKEKGIADGKSVKTETQSQPVPTLLKPGSGREVPQPSKLKRKVGGGFAEVQGHSKILKDSHTPNNTVGESESKSHEQVLQKKPSSPIKAAQQPSQEFCIGAFTSGTETKLVFALYIMAAVLLIQTGVIIALMRTRTMGTQYVTVGIPRGEEYYWRYSGKQDAVWLEQRAELLQEEITLAENLLQNVQHGINHLKVNLKLLEQRHQNSETSTT